MKIFKLKKTVFLKFFFTYSLVLILPIFTLTLFLYHYYFDVLNEKVLNEKQKSLQMSGELIDTQLNHLENTVLQMGVSSDFKPFLFDDDPFDGYKLVRAIRRYTYTNSFSEKIHVFYDSDVYVYSNFNAEPLESYIRKTIPPESDFNLLDKMEENVTYLKSGKSIVIVFPLPAGIPRVAYGKVLFSISSDLILKYFPDTTTYHEIIAPNGQQLFISQGNYKSGNDDVTIKYQSSNNNTYVERIPIGSFNRDLIQYRNIYLLIVMAIIILSFPLVYVLSLSQSNPIKKLSNFVKQATGTLTDGDSNQETDELQWIHDNLDNYLKKINPVMKTQLILDLLNGKIKTTEQISQYYKELQLQWKSSLYTVMILRRGKGSKVSNDDALRIEYQLMKKQSKIFNEVLTYDPPQENEIVLIIGFEEIFTEKDITDLFHGIIPSNYIIGCGNPKMSPESLNTAYSEARHALDYNLLRGGSNIGFFHETANLSQIAVMDKVKSLEVAFETKNMGLIEQELADLEERVENGTLSLSQIKLFYYELLNIAVKINDKWKCPDTFQIEDIENVEEIIRYIREIAENTAQKKEQEIIPDFIAKMQVFIEENISNHLLSLDLLAENFGLSAPYISRSFKRYNGENLSSYIIMLRINRCKELLRNSELSIQDIILNVGYSDPSNFIRMFKKKEAITPGEYRNLYFKKKS